MLFSEIIIRLVGDNTIVCDLGKNFDNSTDIWKEVIPMIGTHQIRWNWNNISLLYVISCILYTNSAAIRPIGEQPTISELLHLSTY